MASNAAAGSGSSSSSSPIGVTKVPPVSPEIASRKDNEYKYIMGSEEGYYTVDLAPKGTVTTAEALVRGVRYVPSIYETIDAMRKEGWELGGPFAYRIEKDLEMKYIQNPATKAAFSKYAATLGIPESSLTADQRLAAARKYATDIKLQVDAPQYNAASGVVFGQFMIRRNLDQSRAVGDIMAKRKIPEELEDNIRSLAGILPRNRQGGTVRRGTRRTKR